MVVKPSGGKDGKGKKRSGEKLSDRGGGGR